MADPASASTTANIGRFNAADADFHRAIVASAGNRSSSQVYADLQPHVHYARLYLSRGVEEEADVAAEHGVILARVPQRRRRCAPATRSSLTSNRSAPIY